MQKIQTGLRLPKQQYEKLLALSNRMGVSLNSIALMLIDVGIKVIELEHSEGESGG